MFKRLLLLSLLFACALSAAVSLSVPAVDTSGNTVTVGTAYISWGSFTDNSGNPVQAGQVTVPITGAPSMSL